MITATAQNTKQMLGGSNGFPSGTYAIPSSSQSPQTLTLFSPVNMLSQSPQQQQQNLLQSMAQAAVNMQQQQQQQQQPQQQQQTGKVGDGQQKNLQQKVVQKVSTSSNQVQSSGAANVAQQQQAQQQQNAQQCVQVSQTGMPGTAQIISPLQGNTGAPQQQMQISTPFGMVPFWTNGLQQLTQNQIIIRGTQPDGTQGVFIQQQPTAATHQALQQAQQQQNRKYIFKIIK